MHTGFELVDVEYVKEAGNWYLRAYIDKPGGIAVDDCEVISRALSDKLDERRLHRRFLHSGSEFPGLGRPLKRTKISKRSIGKEIEVRTFRAIDKQKEFTGILKRISSKGQLHHSDRRQRNDVPAFRDSTGKTGV